MRFLVFQWTLILAYYSLMKVSTVSGQLCLDDQRSLLLQLNKSLVYDPKASSKLAHWNLQNPDCCTWNGVGCDSAGHVISLHLDNESISGGIQNSTLFSLVHLKTLNLALNTMHMEIPKGIKNLTNLASLNFSGSGFTGQIPVEIWTLRSLTTLDLSYRNFPSLNGLKLENPDLIMLTQNLSSLTELYLDYVEISVSARDWFQALCLSLPGLRILSLRRCGIHGPLEYSDPFHHRLLSVIHFDDNNLTKVPDFLTNLRNLSTLTLSSCSLEGTFPSTIFQMTTLENLDLSYNFQLNGVIPPLPQDGSLRTLDLRHTGFSGSLPDSLGYHRMLSKIALPGCNFSGPIPSTIGNLTELVYMDLSFNQFTGPIPPFHTAEKLGLTYINLRSNSLDGSIPPSLFRLPSLEVLSLSSNKLNGAVQFEMFPKLSNLTVLGLGGNKLTVDGRTVNSWSLKYPKLKDLNLASCNMNAFPNLRGLSQLVNLDLSDNLIGGEIPSWVWEIGSGQMQYLNLSGNRLVRLQSPYKLPSNLIMLDLHSNRICDQFPVTPSSATDVDYSNNNFQGPFQIRRSNGFFPDGKFLSLANNSLSGEIPTSLCKAGFFAIIDLFGNLLNGTIPPCLLKRIDSIGGVLNLGRNNLTGEIPDAFPDDCRIQRLDLGWNHLGGKLPSSLANCKFLRVLNVGKNEIHDTFPCMLNASLLSVLVLRSNRFYGNMTCSGIWPQLKIVDAASNSFTGDLKCVSSWRRMMEEDTFDDDYVYNFVPTEFMYKDSVTLTMKGQQVRAGKILSNVFASIDFSNNNFSGEIPEIFGTLKSIYFLNLSHNSLTGRIPKSLGNLTQLESLDISSNQLTGEIPNELGRLSFLSVLNVSYNYLDGKIPEGGQFQTFTEESYVGNLRLCGFPLNTSCDPSVSPATRTTASSVSDVEYDWRFLFVGLGYSVGLLGVVASLTLYGPWRERFNDEVDKYFEMIFSGRRNRIRKRGRRGR